MRKAVFAVLVVFVAALALPSIALAEDEDHGHANHAAVFGGITRTEGQDIMTIGADYERRLPGALDMVGLAVLFDATTQEKGDAVFQTIWAGGVVCHPFMGLKLGVYGGIEKKQHEASANLLRYSIGYDIPMGAISITPTVSVDRVHGHNVGVYGVAAGFGF